MRSFLKAVAENHRGEPIVFLCIGTDRSTGDSLGPWVGTMLRSALLPASKVTVIGSLEHPCDADRLPGVMASLPEGVAVVAIDASLGRSENVGKYAVAAGPLQPARAVGKPFSPVGTYSVAAIVGANGPKPYWTLQTASLYHVIGQAQEIADAIAAGWGDGADLNSWRPIRYNNGNS
ncbi:spore protease YyaC [Cohnella zeiphila]|uniref:Spore protease YyaC n=1 Tax=Cohnella zeiphila TaxID=2761120 RepID=A0A7X0SNH0_9BACL|nr:spore protease YyaC [Cohnella zeiphila]MBB6731955.1 spore protease YyaC [Cohnella zeiphila]